jgi:hypothetical protein
VSIKDGGRIPDKRSFSCRVAEVVNEGSVLPEDPEKKTTPADSCKTLTSGPACHNDRQFYQQTIFGFFMNSSLFDSGNTR